MVHGRGCNPHWSLWRHWWCHNSETIREREKRRPPHAMKSSELSNGENRIALRQLLQNRKLRHSWRHNLGSRWKLQKMARQNLSIGAFYNITKNQDNPIKTVGQESFLSPKTPKNTSFLGVSTAILQECHSKTAQVHLQKFFLPLLISDVQQLYTRQHQKQQFLKATKDNRISATRVHDSGRLNTTCCFYHNQPVYNDIAVNK